MKQLYEKTGHGRVDGDVVHLTHIPYSIGLYESLINGDEGRQEMVVRLNSTQASLYLLSMDRNLILTSCGA